MPLKLITEYSYNAKRNFGTSANSSSTKLANDGKNLLMANRFDEAISKFQQSIEADSSNTQCYFDIARAYTYKQDYPNAIKSYDEYLKHNPKDIEALTMQGECLKT